MSLLNAYLIRVFILFMLEAMVGGIFRAFSRTLASVMDTLPLPGLEGLAKTGSAT